MSNNNKVNDPSELDNIFQKASHEILCKQDDGFCFSVDNRDTINENKYHLSYNRNELTEFINFDLLGEDIKSLNTSNQNDGKNYEDITNDGGIRKIVLDPGVGQLVPEGSIVLLHYIGYISNFYEPFDVTYLQGKGPKRFKLGNNDLLLGLEIGIPTMKYGENARFIIMPNYAYRQMGCPPRIPPNSTVIFDVHLVSYFSPDNFPECFNEDYKDPDKFYKNLKHVKKLHFEGNELFKHQHIEKAVHKYEKAKEMLHLTGCSNGKEEIDLFKYLNKLYSNLSVCYLKLCAFNKVCRMGSEGMKYSERFSKNNAKLWFNWGKALRLLKDFTEGKRKLQKALKLEPQNITIQYELQLLEKDRQFHDRIDELITFKNVEDSERLPLEFWEVFNTLLKEFVDSSDDIFTVILKDNPDDIQLAKHKSSLYNLKFEPLQIVNCFVIKKN